MGLGIGKNFVDPKLRDWVMPDFFTMMAHDSIVASIVFMSAMQKYFTSTVTLPDRLFSVTLQGERADWQKLLDRLDKLPSMGWRSETMVLTPRPGLPVLSSRVQRLRVRKRQEFLAGHSAPYHGWY